jgi:7,8-dihydroneopterin aldolase/epimerase/oxygenase
VTDALLIRGLRVDARVGVTDEERNKPQTVRLDIVIRADLSRPAESDDLGDTIDYSAAVATITDAVRSTECRLLEHLASQVATRVSYMHGVLGVTVEASKEPPPLDADLEAVVVRIERQST